MAVLPRQQVGDRSITKARRGAAVEPVGAACRHLPLPAARCTTTQLPSLLSCSYAVVVRSDVERLAREKLGPQFEINQARKVGSRRVGGRGCKGVAQA